MVCLVVRFCASSFLQILSKTCFGWIFLHIVQIPCDSNLTILLERLVSKFVWSADRNELFACLVVSALSEHIQWIRIKSFDVDLTGQSTNRELPENYRRTVRFVGLTPCDSHVNPMRIYRLSATYWWFVNHSCTSGEHRLKWLYLTGEKACFCQEITWNCPKEPELLFEWSRFECSDSSTQTVNDQRLSANLGCTIQLTSLLAVHTVHSTVWIPACFQLDGFKRSQTADLLVSSASSHSDRVPENIVFCAITDVEMSQDSCVTALLTTKGTRQTMSYCVK